MSLHTDTIKTLIVDDEQLARSVVREHLFPHSEIQILGECANGFEAVKLISDQKPDLVFLDIQMPKLSGFEVLELVEYSPAVIFVTAYDQYALKAFEVHAVDYLLKPFSTQRFEEALAQAKERIGKQDRNPIPNLVAEIQERSRPLERVLIKEGSSVRVLPVETIDYIEAQDDYVAFRAGGKLYLKQQRLGALERLLDEGRFVRIHRSYILNIERLVKLESHAKDSRRAILRDGSQLPVSQSGFDKLRKFL